MGVRNRFELGDCSVQFKMDKEILTGQQFLFDLCPCVCGGWSVDKKAAVCRKL